MSWREITYPLLLAATLFIAARPALSAQVQSPETVDPMARQFAYCTGRLSAQMEFSWLFTEIDGDTVAAQRRTMISLLEAVQAPENRRITLHLRIAAKFAHADLLRRSAFETDATRADYAQKQANEAIGQCLALILS